MEIATVAGATRIPGGRNANERVRRSGMVPAVIYGHGEAPESLALSAHDLEQALGKLAHVVRVKSGAKETIYLLKDVQYDHLQRHPLHVDLMRVDQNERVEVAVPIELRGTAHGTTVGGELVLVLADLHIECPLLQIPDSIRVKVDHLDIGMSVHVKDLELPAGVTPTHGPEDVVCLCRHKKAEVAVVAPLEAETSKEPEVIERGKKEEEAAEEAKK
jgi:large subunit ribosomal protein L25